MRWILAAVACLAAANANSLIEDDDNNFEEDQNHVGIFMPRSLNPRSFYYSYWLYPAMALKNRYMEVGPYADYNYVEPLTFQDVFEKPVFVVTPSQGAQNAFSMFYLHSGLRMMHRYKSFSWLQEFFKSRGLKGLIFYPHLIYYSRFFETPVTSVTLPDDMRMSDFVGIENCVSGRIPYLFVAPEDLFDRMHFENIAKVSDFKVYNDAIEVHPIIALPRPIYEPFYGPPASQQKPAPPTKVSLARGTVSDMNAMDFNNKEDYLGQAMFVRPSAKSEADQILLSDYGSAEYGGQYGYGQSQMFDDRYGYLKYKSEHPGLLQVEKPQYVNAATSDSLQGVLIGKQAIGKTGAQAGAAFGVVKDAYTMQTESQSAIQSGAARNSVANDQVLQYVASKSNERIESAAKSDSAQHGLSRVEGVSLEGHISGQSESASKAAVSGMQTGTISRSESGSIANSQAGSSSSGVETVEVVTVSRKTVGSKGTEQPGIQFPKEGIEWQGGVASSRVQEGSISRTDSTEFGQSGVKSNVQGSFKEGVQGSLVGGSNSGISRTGGVQRITETYTVSAPTEHTYYQTGGRFGIQGGLGVNIGQTGIGGLLKTVSGGLTKIVDSSTRGLGDILVHNEGLTLDNTHQSGSVAGSLSKSLSSTEGTQSSSSPNLESSTITVSKKVVSTEHL